MGLFDFAKDIGHRLFSEEGQAARKIEEHINENNPGIKNLKVDYRDSVAYLSGDADSAETSRKAALMAGNIKGVEAAKVEGVKLPAGVASPRRRRPTATRSTTSSSPATPFPKSRSSSTRIPTSIRRFSKRTARSSRTPT